MAVKRVVKAPGAQTQTSARRQGKFTPAVAALVACGLIAIYVLYLRSDDISPDSIYGYGFAVAGTTLLALVGVGYVARKRLRRNWSRLLHAALRWHIAGGVLAMLLILMHATGNFHPRTGTYALYALIALVVSGIVGKLLDRFGPWLAARAALQTLTPDGEDRLESLADTLNVKRRARRFSRRIARQEPASMPWDLAYYDLSAAPSQIPDLLNTQEMLAAHREATGSQDAAAKLVPSATSKRAIASESATIKRAIGAETFYLQLVRVWRYLHAALSIVTLALILWHLEFAATLLLGKH